MRFVILALVLVSLPIFIALLRQRPDQRALAFTALGFMLLCGGAVRISANVIAWPMWSGIYKGVDIGFVDMLALALLLTRKQSVGRLPFWGAFAFYGATLLFSVVFSSLATATMFAWGHYARLLLLFAAIGGEIARPTLRSALFKGLALGLVLQAGYVIQQKLSGVVQATGTMPHQNMLAMMVELAILPLVAALLAGERSRIVQIGLVAGLIVVVGGGSRAALGLVGGGIVVLTLLSLARQSTPTKLKIVGFGALVLALVAPLGLLTLKERFGARSVITEETERAAFERAARAMAADHPFGVGANLYVTTANVDGYAARAGVAWNFANRSAPVHNAYLLARAETGWLGQIAYMMIIFLPLIAGVRMAFGREKGPNGDLALGGAVALGILAIHNLYEFSALGYPVFSVAVADIGLIASLYASRSSSRARRRVMRARPAAGMRTMVQD